MIEKYKIIQNFLSQDEISLFKIWSEIMHRKNTKFFNDGMIAPNHDTYFYGEAATDALLIKKIPFIEKQIHLNLLPSYSYGRVYTRCAYLKKHKDRPSCDLSLTIQVGSDGTPWPIYMDDKEVILEDGDAVIYKGTEVEHFRERFSGDWHAQIFLHYVEKEGKYKEFYLDKRQVLGTGTK